MSTMGSDDYICPLCEEKFSYRTQFSYTIFGKNLDFKPYGAARIPTPVPQCPKCKFVFFEDLFSDDEINEIKIKSNNIFKDEPNMPNYYYLAKECELLNKNIDEIIYYYHSAIWEDNEKKHFNRLSKIIMDYFENIDEKNSNYYMYKLIKIDFLRRLNKFDMAVSLIESLKNDNNFPHDKYNKSLDYQIELIAKNDIDEHRMPDGTSREIFLS